MVIGHVQETGIAVFAKNFRRNAWEDGQGGAPDIRA